MTVDDAIKQHGAKAVYRAACQHMAGELAEGLSVVGLSAKSMGGVVQIQSAAYKLLTDADRVIDAAQVQASLKRLGRPPLPPDAPRSDKRPRSIRLGDAAWAELQRRGTEALEAWLAKPIKQGSAGCD